ncbi:MAG: hypothetical protein K6G84_05645 [Lachnospiraceae bacterium]|nr:hypothetical protein [Lachnospiraceae bacterium]
MNKNISGDFLCMFSKVTVAAAGVFLALVISVSAVSGGEGGLSDSANKKTESQNNRQSDNSMNIFETYTKVSVGPSRIGYKKKSFRPERVKGDALPEIKNEEPDSVVIRMGAAVTDRDNAEIEKLSLERKVSANKAEEQVEEDEERLNEGFGDDAISFEIDEEKMKAAEATEIDAEHIDDMNDSDTKDKTKNEKTAENTRHLRGMFSALAAAGIFLTIGATVVSARMRER